MARLPHQNPADNQADDDQHDGHFDERKAAARLMQSPHSAECHRKDLINR